MDFSRFQPVSLVGESRCRISGAEAGLGKQRFVLGENLHGQDSEEVGSIACDTIMICVRSWSVGRTAVFLFTLWMVAQTSTYTGIAFITSFGQ